MAEGDYTFAQARTRLEEIVSQVRKKDTTLEKSLDLLEEGVRLANQCTELSDHTEWRSVAAENASGAVDAEGTADASELDAEASPGEADASAESIEDDADVAEEEVAHGDDHPESSDE